MGEFPRTLAPEDWGWYWKAFCALTTGLKSRCWRAFCALTTGLKSRCWRAFRALTSPPRCSQLR